jgi:predicted Zn-dependent peptidase
MSDEQKARWADINKELNSIWVNNQFTQEYLKRGATGMNATTGKEMTNYFVNLPRPAFEFWCWMESERLMRTVMRQFYQERDVVMEERRMRSEDDPEGKLYEMLLGVAYLRHPYRNPVIGYDYDIKRLTASRTDDFRRKYYVPSNMVVSIVGDVDEDRDLPIIQKYFGRLAAGETPPRPQMQEAEQRGEREMVLERDVSPQLYIAYHKPQYPHPDDAPISVMLQILAGGKVSPMYTELVKKRQYVSSIGYDEVPGVAYPNLILFSAPAKNPYTNEDVLNAFDNVLASFKRGHVSEEQLAIAKRAIAMSYLGQMKSNMSLAQDFASAELIYDDWRAPIKWFDEVLKVSTDDVERVASQYLIAENRSIGRIERSK